MNFRRNIHKNFENNLQEEFLDESPEQTSVIHERNSRKNPQSNVHEEYLKLTHGPISIWNLWRNLPSELLEKSPKVYPVHVQIFKKISWKKSHE